MLVQEAGGSCRHRVVLFVLGIVLVLKCSVVQLSHGLKKSEVQVPATSEEMRAADKVLLLPGQPGGVKFDQYAGYVDPNETTGTRHLFYFLAEAEKDAAEKPLVLWLNGGPGCSSLGYGFAEEVGPYRILSNGTGLYFNEYSWNRAANVLFLESPTGTGYSYSDNFMENVSGGDNRTAEDSYTFLIQWLDRFPEYKTRDFYISGESYAGKQCLFGFQSLTPLSVRSHISGHYIPQLAKLIHDRSNDAPWKINLKGLMVGNPVTDYYYDNTGSIDYWYAHDMISEKTHDGLKKLCNYSDPMCCSQPCNDLITYANQVEIGAIDYYSIYTASCVAPSGTKRKSALHSKHPAFLAKRSGYDPCSELNAEVYFNRKDVQKALHANISGMIHYNWTGCSSFSTWTDMAFTVLPIYQELIAADYKIWIYSGDADSVVPLTGTRYSFDALKLPVTVPWYAWYHYNQVGGRSQWYDGLTFVTVRGAGHEVPLLQRARFLQLFSSFLNNTKLPGNAYI